MSEDASVHVGLTGSREAQQRLKELKAEFKSFGSEIGRAAESALGSFANLSMSLTKVDPGSAAEKFRNFRASVTEMSIASGASIDSLKAKFHTLGAKNLLPQEQLVAFSATLARSTHDFTDSSKAIDAIRSHGLLAGKSLEEMGPIAEILKNKMNLSFEQIPDALGRIAGAAEKLGTVGGPGALQDQFAALGDTISQISIKGKGDLSGLIGVMAGIGKGKSPEQAAHLQQQLIHQMGMGNEQSRLNLGVKEKDWYGEDGRFKVTSANVEALRNFYLKRNGSQAGALRQARRIMDPQLAFALFGQGSENLVGNMRSAEGAAPSTTAAGAIAKLAASDHGQDLARQLTRAEREREELGQKTNGLQQGVSGFMPTNPYGTAAINGVGGMVGSMASGYLTRKTFEASAEALSTRFLGLSAAAGKAEAGLVGLGGAASPAAGGAGAGSAAVGAGAVTLAVAAAALLLKGDVTEGRQNQMDTAEEAAQRSGKMRKHEHWFGDTFENIDDPAEQKKAAAEYSKSHPVQVNLNIKDDSGNPNRVVNAAKPGNQ